jgi:hypothetical protein
VPKGVECYISNRHTEGLYWVPGCAREHGNAITDKLTRGGSTQKFIGPVSSLGVSRWNINNKIKCWVDKCGMFLVVLRDRLKNLFQALARLQRPDY